MSTAKGDVTVEEPSRAARGLARRVAESKATIPHLTVAAEIDMERAAAGTSVVATVVKACGLALREHRRVNGAYRDGRFELYGRVNVGITVEAEDAVVVPTIADADRKPLDEIDREVRALAERVQDGTITPPELSGATFTVSDAGAHEITSFVTVIHPQQAAALALGAVLPRAVVRDGAVAVRRTMTATLSCDHRIVTPPEAAAFLARVRALLEQPDMPAS